MQTKNAKIAIIIPIYNVEKYLKACLDSVVAQTHANLSIILVSDGSKDKSLDIAQEYALKDRRILIIDKENGGQASARNAAIWLLNHPNELQKDENSSVSSVFNTFQISGKNAYKIMQIYTQKGVEPTQILSNLDYILFLDSDDFLALNCIETCLNFTLKEPVPEVIWFDYKPFFDGVAPKKLLSQMQHFAFKTALITPQIWLERARERKVMSFWFAWQGLISFSYLKSLQLNFIEGIFGEDVSFGIELFARAKHIQIVNEKLLFYRIRPGSSMNFSQKALKLPAHLDTINKAFDKDFKQARAYYHALSFYKTAKNLFEFSQSLEDKSFAKELENTFLPLICNKALMIEYFKINPLNISQADLKPLKAFISQQPSGAVKRVKEYLSYKVLKTSTKFKGFKKLFLPFALLFISLKHLKDEKNYQQLIQKDISFKRLPPECFKDYQSSLRLKNQPSMQAMSALGAEFKALKKTWYKGGLFKIIIEIFKLCQKS